jgi:uncharacterized protein (DUF433 family)
MENTMTTLVNIGSLIIQTPDVRRGHPRIAGTGVTVQRVVSWYKLGLAPEEIADRFGHLTLAQVHAALAYYHANQAALEKIMLEEEANADQLESEHLSTQNNS